MAGIVARCRGARVTTLPAVPEPTVLLVHGFASSAERNWREPGWIDLLQDVGRTVIAPDVLGHGTAEKPHDPAAYDDVEDQVAAVLPDEPVDAVGFSMGARIVLTLATRQPERFNRIVVGGVGQNLFEDHDAGVVATALREGAGPDTPGIGRLFASFAAGSGNDPEALAACISRRPPPLTTEALGAITCPVLVVLGDEDFAGPADPLVDALPDATLVTLKGVDHFATPKDFTFLDKTLEFLGAV